LIYCGFFHGIDLLDHDPEALPHLIEDWSLLLASHAPFLIEVYHSYRHIWQGRRETIKICRVLMLLPGYTVERDLSAAVAVGDDH